MKEKIFINARIIDPSQNMDEKGSLILNDKGKVKAIGKNVKKTDASKDAEIIDLKDNVLIPGLVDMKAFVGEPGYEYKENFRTLSQAALAGGVTSIVTMPNTKPLSITFQWLISLLEEEETKPMLTFFLVLQ